MFNSLQSDDDSHQRESSDITSHTNNKIISPINNRVIRHCVSEAAKMVDEKLLEFETRLFEYNRRNVTLEEENTKLKRQNIEEREKIEFLEAENARLSEKVKEHQDTIQEIIENNYRLSRQIEDMSKMHHVVIHSILGEFNCFEFINLQLLHLAFGILIVARKILKWKMF